MKRILLALALGFTALQAAEPTITVVHTGALACAYWNSLLANLCRQSVVVVITSENPTEQFVVGIRYLAKDGTETLEARYPVAGREVWFFLDDVKMLSASAGSLTTNKVAIWQSR